MLKDKPVQRGCLPQSDSAPTFLPAIREQIFCCTIRSTALRRVVDFIRNSRRRSGRVGHQADDLPRWIQLPIIEALKQAALNDKQVSVIVELKARSTREQY